MDEKEQTAAASTRFPKWTVAWTVFAVLTATLLSVFSDSLNEQFEWQPALINLGKYLLFFITFIGWLSWLAFFSRMRFRYLIVAVIISLVALFFYRFRVVFDGDLGFVRLQSRFEERTFDVVRKPEASAIANGIDLKPTSSGDFNQFLGNQRDGVVRSRMLDTDWRANPPEILWKKSIGEGWSGFAAVNGYAVTQEQRGQDECITCYDVKTGELKWIHAVSRRHEDTMSMGRVGPRATPTIHQGLVFAQGATGVVDCLDGRNGEVVWSVDIVNMLDTPMTEQITTSGYRYEFEDTGKSSLAWGRSGSPLIYGDQLIVTGGVGSDGEFDTLIALDKNDGTEIWHGGSKMIAYGSPGVSRLLGRDQVTLVAEDTAMGFDPNTGEVLWETPREGASNANANCSQVTRISDDKILLSKGYGLGGELVRLKETESGIQTETIWKNSRILRTKMMSPVILGEYAYSLSDGFLECTLISENPDRRQRVWRKRDRFGNGQLLLVGKHLLVHTEFGKLKLIEATPEKYNELGEIETIDGVCWNTICLFHDCLLVRSEREAACIRLKLESTSLAEISDVSKPDKPTNGESETMFVSESDSDEDVDQ